VRDRLPRQHDTLIRVLNKVEKEIDEAEERLNISSGQKPPAGTYRGAYRQLQDALETANEQLNISEQYIPSYPKLRDRASDLSARLRRVEEQRSAKQQEIDRLLREERDREEELNRSIRWSSSTFGIDRTGRTA
jgi:chromosome segregation ATPase